ncbi:MAG: leucine-rich repeat protein [Clostridia bacterium]
MKKVLCLVLAFLICTGYFCVARAEGDNIKWNIENGILTISGTGDIEDYFDGRGTPWWDYSWKNKVKIEKIVIEEGITGIGKEAFGDLDGVVSVSLPKSVIRIGKSAFTRCSKLSEICLPEGLKTIESVAFAYCALTELDIPASVENISNNAFLYCFNLESITVDKNNLHYMSEDGILYDKNKKTFLCYPPKKEGDYFKIPDGVEIIIGDSFSNCENLEKIDIPFGVKEIGNSAFEGCRALKEINIPDSVESIEYGAFTYCYSLKNVVLPKNLKVVEGFCFSGIEEIVIPEGVETIESGAFSFCKSLKKVSLPDSIKTIGESAFSYCEELESITIPDGVTRVEGGAFQGCKKLTDLVLPDNLEYVGGHIVSFTPLDTDISYVGKYLINCNAEGEFRVKDGTKYIAEWAGAISPKLKSIIIPQSVTFIGDYAFADRRINPVSPQKGELVYAMTALKTVYYTGSEEDWENITIGEHNYALLEAEIVYNYSPISVTINGETVDFSTYGKEPVIKNDRTLVPLRSIFEALGTEVYWNEETRTVTAVTNDNKIVLTIGSDRILVNGEEKVLDAVPEIINDRTMIPLRAVSEAFGCSVHWNDDTQTVEIIEHNEAQGDS